MFTNLLFPIIALFAGIVVLISLGRGPIFLPTEKKDAAAMIEILGVKDGDVAADLGSGDGRLVIALALAGAVAHGFEHNPFLVWWSRYKIRKAGLSGRVFIHRTNFWNEDFSKFTILTVFGIGYIMKPLQEKIRKEGRSGLRVASYTFQFPDLEPKERKNGIYLYEL